MLLRSTTTTEVCPSTTRSFSPSLEDYHGVPSSHLHQSSYSFRPWAICDLQMVSCYTNEAHVFVGRTCHRTKLWLSLLVRRLAKSLSVAIRCRRLHYLAQGWPVYLRRYVRTRDNC